MNMFERNFKVKCNLCEARVEPVSLPAHFQSEHVGGSVEYVKCGSCPFRTYNFGGLCDHWRETRHKVEDCSFDKGNLVNWHFMMKEFLANTLDNFEPTQDDESRNCDECQNDLGSVDSNLARKWVENPTSGVKEYKKGGNVTKVQAVKGNVDVQQVNVSKDDDDDDDDDGDDVVFLSAYYVASKNKNHRKKTADPLEDVNNSLVQEIIDDIIEECQLSETGTPKRKLRKRKFVVDETATAKDIAFERKMFVFRRYKCRVCDASFRPDALTKHAETHWETFMWECARCQFSAANCIDIEKHNGDSHFGCRSRPKLMIDRATYNVLLHNKVVQCFPGWNSVW